MNLRKPYRLSFVVCLILVLGLSVCNLQAQYVRAFLGVGYPDISDGVFDGTLTDIAPGTGESGNFLLVDFEATDPALTVSSITLDFNPSANATIDYVYSYGHNPDGAVFQSGSLNNDVYKASFTGLNSGVDVLYIHFDFDQRSTGTGTPIGIDYIGATLTATLSNGVILSGTFDVVDFFVAFVQMGVAGTLVDPWIRDCDADVGTVPSQSLCPEWWASPDIFIDNNLDGRLDAPVENADNQLRAIVRNRGSEFAQDVTAKFYYRNNTTGLVFPDGATLIGTSTVTVPPGGLTLAKVTWTNLPTPPAQGHWCTGVVLSHSNDQPVSPAALPYEDNNVACANIWAIAAHAGERLDLSFSASSGGETGFGLAQWPREFAIEVDTNFPVAWKWELKGTTENKVVLKSGEEKKATISIAAPRDARPRSGGWISVRQVDVRSGKVVGGVKYQVYEDHFPPEPVKDIKVMLTDEGALLTWEPVKVEAKTGLEEKVAYYAVLRNGRQIAKVLCDEDPFAYGVQWTDAKPQGKRLSYSIRTVDEAGNASARSVERTVRLSAKFEKPSK